MKRRTSSIGKPSGERGAVIFLVVAMVVVFLGVAALAVDLGAWYVARSDAQRAAEAGSARWRQYLPGGPGR